VNALTDHSPARLHMDFSQRQALKDGCRVFDLMVPNDPYKDSWCSARVPAHDYHLGLAPLGRLYGTGYLTQLRPRLREAYHNMSPRLLRLLKPILGH
jgi:CelD/BcsL family acetyltransferase involved in cellulose biosynthesis